jgi:hypothetical protein
VIDGPGTLEGLQLVEVDAANMTYDLLPGAVEVTLVQTRLKIVAPVRCDTVGFDRDDVLLEVGCRGDGVELREIVFGRSVGRAGIRGEGSIMGNLAGRSGHKIAIISSTWDVFRIWYQRSYGIYSA